MKAVLLAGALLCLSACGARVASEAQIELVGMPFDKAQTCLGIPTRTADLGTFGKVAEWDFASAGVSASLPLSSLALLPLSLPLSLAGSSVSVSGAQSCHAIALVSGGKVRSLEYSGETDGLIGRNGNCAPIVRGCLRMLDDEKDHPNVSR